MRNSLRCLYLFFFSTSLNIACAGVNYRNRGIAEPTPRSCFSGTEKPDRIEVLRAFAIRQLPQRSLGPESHASRDDNEGFCEQINFAFNRFEIRSWMQPGEGLEFANLPSLVDIPTLLLYEFDRTKNIKLKARIGSWIFSNARYSPFK